jgi:hypothetical protein
MAHHSATHVILVWLKHGLKRLKLSITCAHLRKKKLDKLVKLWCNTPIVTNRRKNMATRKRNFYADGGHGWLKVTRLELIKLKIADKISGCSYQRGTENVYLEEDCDLSLYINAIKAIGDNLVTTEHFTNKTSKIRGYVSYRYYA